MEKAPNTSVCPRCGDARDQREGPFFVCTDCRWCWTVSITGRVYVESRWPRPMRNSSDTDDLRRARRLLRSVDGLADKLGEPWPTAEGAEALTSRELSRLRNARAATEADYFNEGLPLAHLLQEKMFSSLRTFGVRRNSRSVEPPRRVGEPLEGRQGVRPTADHKPTANMQKPTLLNAPPIATMGPVRGS